VGVARRRAYVGVVQRPLHKLKIAGCAQQLATKVVPEVVEPEVLDSCARTQAPPLRLHAAIGEGVAPPFDVTVAGLPSDIGKHIRWVMAP